MTIHGQTRIIVVKSKDEKTIAARALLRILWSEEDKKPVLFLERIYGDTNHADRIKSCALAKASLLDLPLAELGGDGGACGPLSARGGSAPWEYFDSNYGLKRNGSCVVNDAQLVS